MPVDKFGRSPTTGQNVTNVSGVTHEYVNSNFLQKGQAIDVSGQSIVNLGKSRGLKDAVRWKCVNERFFKKGDPINMNQKAIKNVLPPTEEGDAVTKGYVDSKSAGESDLNMNGNSIRHINPTPIHEDEVVPKQWIENNFLNRYSPASNMARDLNMDGRFMSYLRSPEQNHHAVTKGYADSKLSRSGGDIEGDIGIGGNRFSHLGEPEQDNDAVRLRFVNEYFLRFDGTNRMIGALHAGGFQVIHVGDPCEEQDMVNLRTLQASESSVLEQATAAADMAVGDAITNHANILNRDIRTKRLNLNPQGTATKNFSMGGHYHIAWLPDPTLEHKAVNLRTLNRKVLKEIKVNNLLEAQKYLRLDGENQMVSNLQMNDHKLVGLTDAVRHTDGVNKKVLDEAVNSLTHDLTTETQRYTDNLIVQTNESINEKLERIEGSIAVMNGRIVINSDTDELKERILNEKIDRIEQNFVQRMNDLEFQLRELQD